MTGFGAAACCSGQRACNEDASKSSLFGDFERILLRRSMKSTDLKAVHAGIANNVSNFVNAASIVDSDGIEDDGHTFANCMPGIS